MNDNYLVIIGAHINSDEKRDWTKELLISFSNENIDTCLSVHTSEYLSELAEFSKYVIYDYNNEFIYPSDFYENADLLTTNIGYGHMYFYTNYAFGRVSYNMPHTYHSKAALALYRNGVNIAHSNRYKWVIYIEYDIPIPAGGYKSFIESGINELKSENKKCLYYKNELPGINFLSGNAWICDTDTIFQSNLLIHSDWTRSNRDWIKIWGLSFFEYCIEAAIRHQFNASDILTKSVKEILTQYWNTATSQILSRSGGSDLTIIKDNVFIHILPSIRPSENYELYLFMISKQTKSEIQILNVFVDDMKVLEFQKHELPPDNWFLNKVPYESTSKTVTLDYTITNWNGTFSRQEKFDIANLDSIYKNIAKIEWNVEPIIEKFIN